MQVSVFQKYLLALADAMGSDKQPGKDLAHAARSLQPFAGSTMEQFSVFLALAATKYHETGELPDGKLPKPKRETTPKAEKAPPTLKLTPGQLAARVAELKLALDRGEQLDRDTVGVEMKKFYTLTVKELNGVMDGLQFPKKPTKKDEIFAELLNHVFAARSATDRVKL